MKDNADNSAIAKSSPSELNITTQLNKLFFLASSCNKNLLEIYQIQNTKSVNCNTKSWNYSSTKKNCKQECTIINTPISIPMLDRKSILQITKKCNQKSKLINKTMKDASKSYICLEVNETKDKSEPESIRGSILCNELDQLNKSSNLVPLKEWNLSNNRTIIELKYGKHSSTHKLTAKYYRKTVGTNSSVQQISKCKIMEFISTEKKFFQNVIKNYKQLHIEKSLRAVMQPNNQEIFEVVDQHTQLTTEIKSNPGLPKGQTKTSAMAYQRSLHTQKSSISLNVQVVVKLQYEKSQHRCEELNQENLYSETNGICQTEFIKDAFLSHSHGNKTKNRDKAFWRQKSLYMTHAMISNNGSGFFSQFQIIPPKENIKRNSLTKRVFLHNFKCRHNAIKDNLSVMNNENSGNIFLAVTPQFPVRRYLNSFSHKNQIVPFLKIIITCSDSLRHKEEKIKDELRNAALKKKKLNTHLDLQNNSEFSLQIQTPFLENRLAFPVKCYSNNLVHKKLVTFTNKNISFIHTTRRNLNKSDMNSVKDKLQKPNKQNQRKLDDEKLVFTINLSYLPPKTQFITKSSISSRITEDDPEKIIQIINLRKSPKKNSTQIENINKETIQKVNLKKLPEVLKILNPKLNKSFIKHNDKTYIVNVSEKRISNIKLDDDNQFLYKTNKVNQLYPIITKHEDKSRIQEINLKEKSKYSNRESYTTAQNEILLGSYNLETEVTLRKIRKSESLLLQTVKLKTDFTESENLEKNVIQKTVYHLFQSRLRPTSSTSSQLKVLGVTGTAYSRQSHSADYLTKDPPPALKQIELIEKTQDKTEVKQMQIQRNQESSGRITSDRSQSALEENSIEMENRGYHRKLQLFKNKENIIYEINPFAYNEENDKSFNFNENTESKSIKCILQDDTQQCYSKANSEIKYPVIISQEKIDSNPKSKRLNIKNDKEKENEFSKTSQFDFDNINSKPNSSKLLNTRKKTRSFDLKVLKLFVKGKNKDNKNLRKNNKESRNSKHEDKITSKKKRTVQNKYNSLRAKTVQQELKILYRKEQLDECTCEGLQDKSMKLKQKPARLLFTRVYEKIKTLFVNTVPDVNSENSMSSSETTLNSN